MSGEWERLYGPPQAIEFTPTPAGERRIDACWREIKREIPDNAKIQRSSWAELAKVARRLGYGDIADAWERGGG